MFWAQGLQTRGSGSTEGTATPGGEENCQEFRNLGFQGLIPEISIESSKQQGRPIPLGHALPTLDHPEKSLWNVCTQSPYRWPHTFWTSTPRILGTPRGHLFYSGICTCCCLYLGVPFSSFPCCTSLYFVNQPGSGSSRRKCRYRHRFLRKLGIFVVCGTKYKVFFPLSMWAALAIIFPCSSCLQKSIILYKLL